MARLFDDSLLQNMTKAVAPLTAVPLTMACWFRSDDAAANQCLMSIGDTAVTATDSFGLQANGSAASDPVQARVIAVAGGSSVAAASSTGYSVNTWHHACAVFASATSRAAYIDGGSKGTNAGNRTPAGLDSTGIGVRQIATPDLYMSGRIAEAGLWNVALTDDEVLALARGVRIGRIRPTALVGYWPMWGNDSPELDYTASANALTLGGVASTPTAADGPPVAASRWLYASSLLDVPAAGGAVPVFDHHYRRQRAA